MSNNEDCANYIAAARAYLTRGDTAAAVECLDQAAKLWAAETACWADENAELEAAVVRQTSRLEAAHIHETASRPNWGTWNEPSAR